MGVPANVAELVDLTDDDTHNMLYFFGTHWPVVQGYESASEKAQGRAVCCG